LTEQVDAVARLDEAALVEGFNHTDHLVSNIESSVPHFLERGEVSGLGYHEEYLLKQERLIICSSNTAKAVILPHPTKIIIIFYEQPFSLPQSKKTHTRPRLIALSRNHHKYE